MTLWIFLAVKCPLESISKPYGRATAMPTAWGLMPQPYCLIDDMTNIRFQRLAQPDTCSDGLYKIIMKCWEFDHRKRPDFTALLSLLQNYDGST